jgi:hypothetical protein
MKYLLLALLVLSTSVMSQENSMMKASAPKLKNDSKGTLDVTPKSKTEDVTEDKALVMKPDQVKMVVTCKAKDGHELKHGDKGYEECIQKMKNDKKNPHAPNADVKVDFKKE